MFVKFPQIYAKNYAQLPKYDHTIPTESLNSLNFELYVYVTRYFVSHYRPNFVKFKARSVDKFYFSSTKLIIRLAIFSYLS